MRLSFITSLSLIASLLITGCSSRKYFEPKDIAENVKFDSELSHKLKYVSKNGATMENNQVITENGLLNLYLPDGYKFLTHIDNYTLATSESNQLKIFQNEKELQTLNFESMVVSANLKNNLLGLVLADNTIVIYNIENNSRVFSLKLDNVYAVNSKIASPVFLNDLLLVPSLDGKIVIIDLISFKLIRDIVVSSDKFFSNIIFLNVVDNRLICATTDKILSINPGYTNSKKYDIRDVMVLNNSVYVFTVDGKVALLDLDLNLLREKKFEFAHFIGNISGKYIYTIEKEGYLIALDKNLVTSNIFKLDDKLDGLIFASKNKIYFENRYFELKQ